jgi:hypothetical protein
MEVVWYSFLSGERRNERFASFRTSFEASKRVGHPNGDRHSVISTSNETVRRDSPLDQFHLPQDCAPLEVNPPKKGRGANCHQPWN